MTNHAFIDDVDDLIRSVSNSYTGGCSYDDERDDFIKKWSPTNVDPSIVGLYLEVQELKKEVAHLKQQILELGGKFIEKG